MRKCCMPFKDYKIARAENFEIIMFFFCFVLYFHKREWVHLHDFLCVCVFFSTFFVKGSNLLIFWAQLFKELT